MKISVGLKGLRVAGVFVLFGKCFKYCPKEFCHYTRTSCFLFLGITMGPCSVTRSADDLVVFMLKAWYTETEYSSWIRDSFFKDDNHSSTQEIPAFYVIMRFMTVFRRVHQQSLFWSTSTQCTPSQSVYSPPSHVFSAFMTNILMP